MTMSDKIADMLTRIRNGQKAKLLNIELPGSKLKLAILKVLEKEGYIKKVHTDNGLNFRVELKYSDHGEGAIQEIHKVSKPGRRVYTSSADLKKGYYNNMGIYIVSTPKGVITDAEALDLKVGGEIICKIF